MILLIYVTSTRGMTKDTLPNVIPARPCALESTGWETKIVAYNMHEDKY